MSDQLKTIIEQYDPNLALDYASTIPSSWYIDKDFYDHELQTVFSQSWQLAAHGRQLTEPGKYVTTDIAGEPVVIVRGNDGELRGFFNVCSHHAAAATGGKNRVSTFAGSGWPVRLARSSTCQK